MRSVVCAVFLVTAVVALHAQQPPSPREPLVREGVTEKISAHVHVIPDDNVVLVPNVGIIVGTNGMLVIDTGMGERNGATVLREAQKLKDSGTLYLATTHIHPEHDLGAGAFPKSTVMIRSEDQEKEIAETGLATAKVFSDRSPAWAELLKGARFRAATVTFSNEHLVDLGGVRVRMIAMGPNHTVGDTAFLVEPDGVLFAGDIVMPAQPALSSPRSNVHHWLESLTKLEALHPTRIVPSHGAMGDASMIANYKTYFETIENRVAASKKAGRNIEETAQGIATELQNRYPDRNRTMAAVRVAYNQQ